MPPNPPRDAPGGGAGWRRTTFVAVTVAFALFLYLFSPFNSLFLGWFVDFEDNISHRVHEVTFGIMFAILFVGVVAQLRRPERNVAGLQQALVGAVVLAAVVAASTGWEWTALLYVVPLLAMAALHPARAGILRVPRPARNGMQYLALAAALPLLFEFATEFERAVDGIGGHQNHWGGMASFALVVVALSFLAAAQGPGWRVTAWSVSLAVVLFATASLRYPFDASAAADLRGIFALAWGVLFLAASEVAARRARSAAGASGSEPARDHVGRDRIRRWVVAVPVAVVTVLAGMFAYAIADNWVAPRVPHEIVSSTPVSCVECHGTGLENAPVIDPATHQRHGEAPRTFLPLCSECHRLPRPVSGSQAVAPGAVHPAGGDGLITPVPRQRLEAVLAGRDLRARR